MKNKYPSVKMQAFSLLAMSCLAFMGARYAGLHASAEQTAKSLQSETGRASFSLGEASPLTGCRPFASEEGGAQDSYACAGGQILIRPAKPKL